LDEPWETRGANLPEAGVAEVPVDFAKAVAIEGIDELRHEFSLNALGDCRLSFRSLQHAGGHDV
jgi:hypothetical protein